jgi:hypothetical protein
MDARTVGRRQVGQHTRKLVWLLLTPSWLSGIICTFLAFAITAALLVEARYQGSDLQQQYLHWQTDVDANSASSAAGTLQKSTASVVGYIELFIFWYAVGTVLYLAVSALYRTVRGTAEARQNLQYVHVSRRNFLRELYARLALRVCALAVWAVYGVVTLKIIMPYLLGAIHVGDEHIPAIGAIALLVGATFGLLLAFHVQVILLRLSLARPRALYGDAAIILSKNRQ